ELLFGTPDSCRGFYVLTELSQTAIGWDTSQEPHRGQEQRDRYSPKNRGRHGSQPVDEQRHIRLSVCCGFGISRAPVRAFQTLASTASKAFAAYVRSM